MAISRFLPPLNGTNYVKQINQPYIDDIFDPLFTRDVRNYYDSIYGNNLFGRLAGIGSGYAQMWENALAGQKGILGPGMGILSTFGRSMDKADDTILGTLTEGVNALGQVTGGSNVAPTNPIKNIFVEDQNYTGTKLLSAIGNNMAKLAGTEAALDESDFTNLGDKISGTSLDLMTDPGIAGSQLARLNKGTAVGKVGNLMYDYDNFMANVAGNMTLPGFKFTLGKLLNQIRDVNHGLGTSTSDPLQDTVIKSGKKQPEINPAQLELRQMADNIAESTNLNIIDNPEEYTTYEKIVEETTPQIPNKDITPDIEAKLAKFEEQYQADRLAKRIKNVESLKAKTEDYKNKMWQNINEGLSKNTDLFPLEAKSPTYDSTVANILTPDEYGLISSEQIAEAEEYIATAKAAIENTPDAYEKALENLDYYRNEYYLNDDEAYIEFLKTQLPDKTYFSRPYLFTNSKAVMNMLSGEEQLNIIASHLQDLQEQLPEGFKTSYFRKELPGVNVSNDVISQLYYISKNELGKSKKGKAYIVPEVNSRGLEAIRGSLNKEVYTFNPDSTYTIETSGIIPWINKNENALLKAQQKGSKLATALLKFRDDIVNDLIEPSRFEEIIQDPSIQILSKSESEILDGTNNLDNFILHPNGVVREKYSPVTSVNQVINWNNVLTNPEQNLGRLAKDLGSLDIMVNPNLPINEQEYYKELLDKYYKSVKKANPFYPKVEPIAIRDVNKAIAIHELKRETFKNNLINKAKTVKEISKLPAQEAAEVLTTPKSIQEERFDEIVSDTFAEFKEAHGLPQNLSTEETLDYVNKFGTEEDQRLVPLLEEISDSVRYNQLGIRRGALYTPIVKKHIANAEYLTKNGFDNKKVENYLSLMTSRQDQIIKGNEFISDVIEAQGYHDIPLAKNDKNIPALRQSIINNINKLNSKTSKPVFSLIDVTDSNFHWLGYQLNWDNTNLINDIQKVKNMELEDIVFQKGDKSLVVPNELQPLENFFKGISYDTTMLSKEFGIEQTNDEYVHLHMSDSPEASKFATEHQSLIGYNDKRAQQALDLLRHPKYGLIKKGSFGVMNFKRSSLGPVSKYPGVYSSNLKELATSSFTDGMFANNDAQTVIETFISKNFALQNRFDSPEKVKEALFPKTGSNPAGNTTNLALVTLARDSKGQIKGIKRYNKFDDTAIAKAFQDPEAILCPETSIAHLDSILKKEIKIPSKFQRFIQDTIMPAYKAAILNNPGFPLGNVEDATHKQAVEFSRKYGTSYTEEMYNAGRHFKQIIELNNNFEDSVIVPLRSFLTTNEAKADPIYRKWTSDKVGVTGDLVLMNPEARTMFTKYVNEVMPAGPDRNIALVMLDLSTYINPTLSKFKDKGNTVIRNTINKDLEDIAKNSEVNPYMEQSLFNRILYGNQFTESRFGPQGFANNSLSRFNLKLSEDIEVSARLGTVLNSMEHNGYDLDKMFETLEFTAHTDAKANEAFRKAMEDAVNTMNTTNFNYESTSKLHDHFAKYIPFPTFFIKNLAFWLAILVENPQILDNTISVHEGLWSGHSTKDEFTAEAKGRGAVPIGQPNKHLTGLVKQTPYNSMFGAFGTLNNPREDLSFRMNPAHRYVTRHLLQKDEDVKYRPYNSNVYQRNIKKGDPEFSELAYLFHQLNPYERQTNTYLRTPKKVSNNTWQLSDLFPSLFQPDFKK